MPSSYTTSLRLTLPATGELAGQWGNTVNTGITELLDSAVAGTASISTWGGPGIAYTLSNNSGTADEARRMFIVATGAPGEAKNVVCPAVSKFYVLRNDTTGGFALTLKTPAGSGISVPAGQYKFLYCNGTDVVEMFNSAGALTLSGALSVGGTATFAANPTLSAGTANQVQYLNASKVLVGSPNMTFNGTDLTVSGTVNATTLDLTNIEVTNIKAKDGTSAANIADSTGVMSLVANPVLSGGTANGVAYANASKVLTTGSALTFDGTDFASTGIIASINVNGLRAQYPSISGYYAQLDSRDGNTYLSAVGSTASIIFRATDGPGTTAEGMRLTSTGLSLAATSDLTLNKGTANGVLYLNGSKVATSGSALTYNGSALSLYSTVAGLSIQTALNTNQATITLADADSRTLVLRSPNSGSPNVAQIGTTTNHDVAFLYGGTEQMRLNSSGLEVKGKLLVGYSDFSGLPTNGAAFAGSVGIGTSSPVAKLQAYTTAAATAGYFQNAGGTGSSYGVRIEAGSNSSDFALRVRDKSDTNTYFDVVGDGTVLIPTGNLGIGTNSPGYKLSVSGTSGAAALNLVETGVRSWLVRAGGVSTNTFDISDATAGQARLVIDSSGNVGIGASSPGYKLDVQNTSNTSARIWTTGGTIGNYAELKLNAYNNFSGQSQAYLRAISTASGNSGTALAFATEDNGFGGPVERMVLDPSGNLTLGNAAASTNRTFNINGVVNKASRISFQESGVDRWLIGNGAASENGNFEIYDATNGNNFILTRSGNLGLGVTPSAWSGLTALQVSGTAALYATNSVTGLSFNQYFNGTSNIYLQNDFANRLQMDSGTFKFFTAPSGTAGNPITGANAFVQTMTLDASGNLGVGATNPFSTLHIRKDSAATQLTIDTTTGGNSYGGVIASFGNTDTGLAFSTKFNSTVTEKARISSDGTFRVKGAGTAGSTDAVQFSGSAPADAMRLTSGGDLLVGTTSGAFTGKVVALQATSASNVITAWNSATAGDNSLIGFFTDGGTGRGSITYNRAGGLVAYNTTSDHRAKDIIGPVQNPGATIDALKVYEGVMKGATQSRPMLVAHEAQAVAPYAVTGEKDAVNDNGDPVYQQMDVSSLVPLLLAEIQSLRARVAALESN